MKIALITRHFITNYGSLLQTIATQNILNEMGYECEIIDYIRECELYYNSEKTLLKNKSKWNKNFFTRTLYLFLRQPFSIISGKKFRKMQLKYLNLTKPYHSIEQLQKDKPEADIYMTGSDQVWGPISNGTYDESYILSFCDEKDKKISYAASFGHTNMTEELKEYFYKGLSSYNSILVRENSAKSILEEINIKSEQVLDPTLLMTKEDWEKYTKKINGKKYILVYQLHNDKKLNEYAKRLSQEKNIELVRVTASFHQLFRGGRVILLPDLEKFLTLIKNAECLITDSFHGTAFAINLNTQFIEILPNNNTGTRNQSILELTGLSDRILKNQNDYSIYDKKIDYNNVNRIIEKERKESFRLLKDALKQDK